MKQHELLIMRDIFSQRNVDHGCEQTFSIHDIYFFYTQDQEALSTIYIVFMYVVRIF